MEFSLETRLGAARVPHICVKDTNDLAIPVHIPILVILVFTCNQHDVGVETWDEIILVSMHVIRCVIDSKGFVSIDHLF